MDLFPHFPLHLNSIVSLGFAILLGLISGEIARHTRVIPRISGYILAGVLVGPAGFNIVTQPLLIYARFFVDVSLGLILFELGRQLDFIWLKHDRGLLPMSIMESGLTFLFLFIVLYGFHLPWLSAALVATIAIATSPAVVMLVAHDLAAEGPVKRRTYILTSLNNLYALIMFIVLVSIAHLKPTSHLIIIEQASYQLFGSFLLGILMFIGTSIIGLLTGKRKESQLVLFIGVVLVTIGISLSLHLSSMLALFTLGVAARNLDQKHILVEVDLGWLLRLFFIILFVVTGIYLQFRGIWTVTWMVIGLILFRFIAKLAGVLMFSKVSHLTIKQAVAVALTLSPLAGVAIGMSNIIIDFNPVLGGQLIIIISVAVAILTIVSPIITQLTFIKMGEALQNNE